MRPQFAHGSRVAASHVAAFAVLVYLVYYLVAGHAARLFAALLPAFS